MTPELLLVCLAMASGEMQQKKKPASPGSCPELRAYEDRWLIIVATSAVESEARKLASAGDYCVLPQGAFLGLKPGLFVVVAGARADRKSAQQELRRVRSRHKDAYLKAAGRLCPTSGVNAPPGVLQKVSDVEASMDEWSFETGGVRNTSQFWEAAASSAQGPPRSAEAKHHEGRHEREESYGFDQQGRLSWAEVHSFWDVDDEKDAPGEPAGRRYYLLGNDCYFKSAVSKALVCLQPCARGIAAKIVARAGQVVSAARARGAAFEKIVGTLDSQWVEKLE